MFDFKLGNWSGISNNITINLCHDKEDFLLELCHDLLVILPPNDFFEFRKNEHLYEIGNINDRIKELRCKLEANKIIKNNASIEKDKERLDSLQKYQYYTQLLYDKMDNFLKKEKTKNTFELYKQDSLHVACINYLIALENESKQSIGLEENLKYWRDRIMYEIKKNI